MSLIGKTGIWGYRWIALWHVDPEPPTPTLNPSGLNASVHECGSIAQTLRTAPAPHPQTPTRSNSPAFGCPDRLITPRRLAGPQNVTVTN